MDTFVKTSNPACRVCDIDFGIHVALPVVPSNNYLMLLKNSLFHKPTTQQGFSLFHNITKNDSSACC